MVILQSGKHFLILCPMRRTKQGDRGLGYCLKQLIGTFDFIQQFLVGEFREKGMSVTVIPKRKTGFYGKLTGGSSTGVLNRIVFFEGTQILSHLKEDSFDLKFFQDFYDAIRITRMRAVVKG